MGPPAAVDQSLVGAFASDGAVCVRGAFSPGEVALVERGIAAGGISGDRRRRAFSVRFLGDDATHAPRPWKTSPDFPGLPTSCPGGAAGPSALSGRLGARLARLTFQPPRGLLPRPRKEAR